MSSGTVHDFHGGLSGRIGMKSILDGGRPACFWCADLHPDGCGIYIWLFLTWGLFTCPGDPVVGDFFKVVKSEHCERSDSNLPFHTSNYGIKTTPAQEWEITTQQNESKADMRHKRRLPNPEELWQSDVARNAGLRLIEVIVIVLYTGPMVRGPVPPYCTGVRPCKSLN